MALGGLARAVTRSLRQDADESRRTEWTVFTIVSILYLFLRESLISHGAVYWPHSIAQLPLIFGAWFAFRVFEGRANFLTIFGLLLVLIIYPALEWTGFVFALGVSFALFLNWRAMRHDPDQIAEYGSGGLWLAIAALCAPILSGIALVVHFSIAIGIEDLLNALSDRAVARSFDFRALFSLIPSYIVSFGALLPISVLSAVQISRKEMLPLKNSRRYIYCCS